MFLKNGVSSCSTRGGENKPLLMSLNRHVSLGHVLHKLKIVLYGLNGLSVCTCGHPFSSGSVHFPLMEESSLRMCLAINRGLFRYLHWFSTNTVITEGTGAGPCMPTWVEEEEERFSPCQSDAEAERLS